jgi:hypothetical protein
MASFQQLKSSRDKRHVIQSAQLAALMTPGASGSAGKVAETMETELPPGVEIRTDEKRGRGLYATSDFRAGQSANIHWQDPVC